MRVNLLPGERVIVRTRPSLLPLAGPVVGGFVVLAAGGFGLGYLGGRQLPELGEWQVVLLLLAIAVVVLLLVLVVVRPLVRWSSTRYVLTSLRLIHRRGAGRRTEHDIPLSSGLQVRTEQSLLQRLTGSGTLMVGAHAAHAERYRDVPQVRRFKEYLGLVVSELPSIHGIDGVDRDSGPQYSREGTSGPWEEWHRGRPE
ncbi:PH domain-containing protein [Arthrobacter echini]|uniref:PH domain-containing protein n=1 Tax=Arthrobacter echini TaxID=1529066 RepID=A0A5D0XR96_9MICC|nr:PH domain-containing protein [Arthrobacter echini]